MRTWLTQSASISLTAAALLFCAPPARAQISLASAVDLAFRTNPKVLSAQADVDHAHAVLSEARDAFVPVVGVSGGIGKSTGVPLGGPPEVFNLSAQSLVFNFSQRDYIRSAHSGWDAARFSLEQAQDDVAEDVVTTYIQLDNAQARRAAATTALTHAQKLLDIVTDRVAAGTDAHSEIPRSDLTVAQMQQQIAHIEAEIAELSDHLSRLTGLSGSLAMAVHDSIPPLPSSESLRGDNPTVTTPAIEAAKATAKSRFEAARGDSRYMYRPQLNMGANYARITAAPEFSNFELYYPGFNPANHKNISYNALAFGVTITVPLLDRGHIAKARESAADARKASYDVLIAQNLFAEGRLKLQRATTDLELSERVAQDYADIAQDELDAVLVQLAPNAVPVNGQPLTPKDEQKARLSLAQKQLDVLTYQLQLEQAKISLLRQNGRLHTWLGAAIAGAPAH